MPVKYLWIAAAAFLSTSTMDQESESQFCSSRTTPAYHSPRCDWGYAVRDPQRVEDVRIPHRPAYHTYSRWVLSGQTFVLAYRDREDRPDDMVVDVYANGGGNNRLVGSARILGIVTSVTTANLTGSELPDLVVRFEGGQLQYIDVLRFSGGAVHQVFQYGASSIELIDTERPMIEATSKDANLLQRFAWDSQSNHFIKIAQRTAH